MSDNHHIVSLGWGAILYNMQSAPAYFFILGKNPDVSLAEVCAVLRRQHVVWRPCFVSRQALGIVTQRQLDARGLMAVMGGVQKIGELREQTTVTACAEKLSAYFPQTSLKRYVGVSVYSARILSHHKEVEHVRKRVEKGLLAQKHEHGSMRVVTSREQQLSSVIVQKNKLLSERGVEVTLFVDEASVWLGTTVAVQPFASYGARDYARPGRDIRSGMLPPKLAQVLINLTGAKSHEVLWDPFCGSGTVVQEALLMGFTKLIGSDKRERAIEDTKKNLSWLEEHETIAGADVALYVLPIEDAKEHIHTHAPTVIATEPYLGPPLTGKETSRQVDDIRKSLTELYAKSFKIFEAVLPQGCVVSMVFPAWRVGDAITTIDIAHVIRNTAFQPQRLLNDALASFGFQHANGRLSVLYGREAQKVLRELWVFKKY